MDLLTKTSFKDQSPSNLNVLVKHFTKLLSKSNLLIWISEEKITNILDFLCKMYVYERETSPMVPNQMKRTKKIILLSLQTPVCISLLINGHDY